MPDRRPVWENVWQLIQQGRTTPVAPYSLRLIHARRSWANPGELSYDAGRHIPDTIPKETKDSDPTGTDNTGPTD